MNRMYFSQGWFATLIAILLVAGGPLAGPVHAAIGWEQVSTQAPWGLRSDHSAVVFNDRIWVLGGIVNTNGSFTCKRDVWCSADGANWTQMTSEAPWPGRYWAGVAAYNGRLWLAGGYTGDGLRANDVWSTTDGRDWRAEGSLPADQAVVQLAVHADQLWALTNDQLGYKRASAWSSDDGRTWDRIATDLPVSPVIFKTASLAGQLWLIGGVVTAQQYAAIHSPDGRLWTGVTDGEGWLADRQAGAAVHRGQLWVLGGKTSDEGGEYGSRRVLVSTADGATWTRESDAAWSPRTDSAAVSFHGRLYVLGGVHYRPDPDEPQPLTDIWRTTLATGPAVLDPIPDLTAHEAVPFSYQPTLAQGSDDVMFTLSGGPAGLMVDSATGALAWTNPLLADQPGTLTLRATNIAGQSEQHFHLTILPQRPPRIVAPEWSKDHQCTVRWTAVSNVTGDYTVQMATTADFATPLAEATVHDPATPPSGTLNGYRLTHTFSELADEQVYYFRVRGHKTAGLASAWSAPTSTTQDATSPTAALTRDTESPGAEPYLLRLVVAPSDPGERPSGTDQMRFSLDGVHWTAWEPVGTGKSLAAPAGPATVRVQVTDRAGNLSEQNLVVMVTAGPPVLFVDDDNTTGPWDGSFAHPYKTIQPAVIAATSGTQVVVAPGQYIGVGNYPYPVRDLVLRSVNPLDPAIVRTTVITGYQFVDNGTCLTLQAGQTAASEVAGFTLTQIYNTMTGTGSAVNGAGSRATIRNNRILYNKAYSKQFHFQDLNYIYYNLYSAGGGLYDCDGLIRNNVIAFNKLVEYVDSNPEVASAGAVTGEQSAAGKPVPAGGLWPQPTPTPIEMIYPKMTGGGALYGCDGMIENNTIWGNEGPVLKACKGTIRNNIIATRRQDGWLSQADQALLEDCSAPDWCCIPGWRMADGGLGNLLVDPLLVDPEHGDFHLRADSPCIDAGVGVADQPTDAEGDARGLKFTTGTGGDGSGYDMGADEYRPTSDLSPLQVRVIALSGRLPHAVEVTVYWASNLALSGTAIHLELHDAGGRVTDLGSDYALSGRHTIRLRLPAGLSAGAAYRIVARSAYDPQYWAASPPVIMAADNATGGEWTRYE